MKHVFIALVTITSLAFGFVTTAWQAEWAETVAAAKREGKVVVIGPQGPETREALTEGFQRKYPEIQVEHSGAAGAQLPPKLLAEQKSERYSVDLLVQGTTTVITGLMPAKAVIPIQPFLAGSNTQDASVWLNKKFSFADEAGQYNLVMTVYILPPFIYNPTMISPKEITAWKDLLAPKWKGKLVVRDPRLAGGGLAITTFWYANPRLGKDFIQRFFSSQDVALSRDDRQLLDFVGQRKYPIAIGPSEVLTKEWMGKGLPVRQFNAESLQEGALTTAGNGAIAVPRNPPHPNALKVYIDYLLSKQGQTEWSKAIGFASLRQDVPRDHVAEHLIPKEGVQYMDSHLERYVNLRNEVVAFLNTVLPR
ncbi:MAG TPA: extracellular solute-binding protein [Methylomirabilota bacterium]|nr:extracellular solute-binding protein [Methylomirabilota bacterium]